MLVNYGQIVVPSTSSGQAKVTKNDQKESKMGKLVKREV
jgi:hypothetical protein